MQKRGLIFFLAIAFVAAFSSPFWLNIGKGPYQPPELTLPQDQKACIEPAEFMRAKHMDLLNTWRDEAIREGKTIYVATDGKKWEISLQNTCMECHVDKAAFCDTCHLTNNVSPSCWTCHIEPEDASENLPKNIPDNFSENSSKKSPGKVLEKANEE